VTIEENGGDLLVSVAIFTKRIGYGVLGGRGQSAAAVNNGFISWSFFTNIELQMFSFVFSQNLLIKLSCFDRFLPKS
jgi:hypothetical protein